jgi:hypothetical protein
VIERQRGGREREKSRLSVASLRVGLFADC